MEGNQILINLFSGLHNKIESELGIARGTINHAPTLGTACEDRWINMFRDYLPKRYEVNRAIVIDSNGAQSEQIDVVIHDRQYSPFVLNLNEVLYIPAESVYAVLEVKQTLNVENVRCAANRAASVRKLHRTSVPIKHAGGEYPAKPLHPILAGLVTLESNWTPPLGEAFQRAVSGTLCDGRLDLGCAVRHGVFGVHYPPNDAATITVETSSASLALFLLRLIATLQEIATVPCIDVLAYAAHLSSEVVE